MNNSPQQLWDKCLLTIKKNVSAQSFTTWFEPIKPISFDQNVMVIQVPNKFFYEWLEEHYVALLKMTLTQEIGKEGRLEYQILKSAVEDRSKPLNVGSSRPNNNQRQQPQRKTESGTIKNPFVIPGIKKMAIDPQLNPSYTFSTLIEGDCNKLGRNAGLAVAKNPGGTAFNPLVLFGDVGLGKTHLAQAIGNEVLRNFDTKTVLYVSSEKFTNQIIQSIKNNAVNDFVNFYQLIDVLVVDDIQFLANKVKTQEIFFHIFNQLHQNGKQIILTSDRPPKDMDGMEERLTSRFKWGLTADLQAPDLETRIAILQSKMESEGYYLPPEVIEYVCYNVKDNIRELEGVLISLIAQSSLNNREIDIPLAKDVIKNFVNEINKEVSIDNIQSLVANHFKLTVEKLESKTRKREIVLARQLAMYFCKNMTDKTYKNIGNKFGGRDHSTVIHSCRAIQDLRDTDSGFNTTVEGLEKELKMNLSQSN